MHSFLDRCSRPTWNNLRRSLKIIAITLRQIAWTFYQRPEKKAVLIFRQNSWNDLLTLKVESRSRSLAEAQFERPHVKDVSCSVKTSHPGPWSSCYSWRPSCATFIEYSLWMTCVKTQILKFHLGQATIRSPVDDTEK